MQKDEELYILGTQWNFIYDFNSETFGLNRKTSETFKEYIQRVKQSDIIYKTKDTCINDLMPIQAMRINDKIKTYNNAFYFSITSGLRGHSYNKKNEVCSL